MSDRKEKGSSSPLPTSIRFPYGGKPDWSPFDTPLGTKLRVPATNGQLMFGDAENMALSISPVVWLHLVIVGIAIVYVLTWNITWMVLAVGIAVGFTFYGLTRRERKSPSKLPVRN